MKQYVGGGGGSLKDNPKMLAVGALVGIGVIAAAYAFANATTQDPASATGTTTTTIPVIVVDPRNAESDKPFFPPEPGEEYLEGPQDSILDIEHRELPDYTEIPMPADQFEVVFPQNQSGLQPAEFAAAKETGGALLLALNKGVGRERFPNYFPGNRWPPPVSPDMVVDFTYAEAVANQPDLIRTVVIWHGTTAGGEVTLQQVRVSQYLRRGPGGALTPVRAGDVPATVQATDGLLRGVSIIA